MTKAKTTIIDKATAALMDLIAKQGWEKATLHHVAEHAGVSLPELVTQVQNRFDLLDHFGDTTNARAIKIADEEGGSEAVRDKLFALIMARFDVLQPHKPAIRALAKSARRDPGLALYFAHKIRSSMSLLLESAGVDAFSAPGRVKSAGLSLLYGKVVRTWFKDETEDLAKTMKALDSALADAERWGKRLSGNWKGSTAFWKRKKSDSDTAVQAV